MPLCPVITLNSGSWVQEAGLWPEISRISAHFSDNNCDAAQAVAATTVAAAAAAASVRIDDK